MSTSLKLDDQLAYLIASVNKRLEDELSEALKPQGLSIEQFRVLNALDAADGSSMGELAAAVLLDAGTLTKIIDRMVTESSVYRGVDPHDRRRVLIHTAPKGAALFKKARAASVELQRTVMRRMGEGQLEQLTVALRGLNA